MQSRTALKLPRQMCILSRITFQPQPARSTAASANRPTSSTFLFLHISLQGDDANTCQRPHPVAATPPMSFKILLEGHSK